MAIPRETIDAIRENTDIVQLVSQFVSLKRAGNSWKGLCPFHQEKSPSFHVIPHKGIYHCFGCGEGGDSFKFIQKVKGLSFIEAVKELAGPAGITIQERELSPQDREQLRRKTSVREACEEAASWFHSVLMTSPMGAKAREYLTGRGIERDTVVRFRMGYAPEGWTHLLDHLHGRGVSPELAAKAGLARHNERRGSHYDLFRDRVIVPIFDERDRPIAFGGRLLQGEGPKYINSPETEIYEKSSVLYGLNLARAAIQKKQRVIVVEGYFDVISLAQAGFEETVATCGTAMTPLHMKRIRQLTDRAIALFDSDAAGTRAADRSLPLFLEAGVEVRRLDLPGAKDPDEYVQREGAEAFEKRLDSSIPLLHDVLHRAVRQHGTGSGRAVDAALPLLRRVPANARSGAISRAAGILAVDEATLRRAVGSVSEGQAMGGLGGHGARWVGNIELNHILWLLLHHPDQVTPALAETDPQQVTDRPDVQLVVARLMGGDQLAAILDEMDPDVARVLQAAAAREGLYTEEQAPRVIAQILARLELKELDRRLSGVRAELSSCDPALDESKVKDLLRQRSEIQTRRNQLKPLTGWIR